MSKSKCIPLFDGTARTVLRHMKRAEALEMVGRGDAFVLASDPLEIALTRKPARKETDGRPDLSLTVPPGVVLGAADGSPACRAIVDGYEPNHREGKPK
jgi:hypothetical protein